MLEISSEFVVSICTEVVIVASVNFLVVLGDEDVRILYPKRNRKNTLRFLEEIVGQNHELIHQKSGHREQMLATAMGKVKNIVTHDFLVIVISDFIAYSPKVIQYLARLNRHNRGYEKTMRPYSPFQLIYKEEFSTRKDARIHEKYLKSGIGKEFLKGLD